MELSVISSTLAVTLHYNNAILTICNSQLDLHPKHCQPIFDKYNVNHSIGDSYTSIFRSIAVPNGMANIV